MKINTFFIAVAIITLSSCSLDGVENNNKNNLGLDSSFIKNNLIPESENDNTTPKLKTDTLNTGEANNMVWNGDGGLRIEWDKKGTGSKIQLHDVVMVNYDARVARGDVYDSNSEIGQPVALKTGIGQLIEGWEKGLLQMSSGDVGRMMIPSKMGYGEEGLLGVVPQNADIIVEIEITSIIQPIELKEGVKVYKYQYVAEGIYPQKNQTITFDYFTFKTGSNPGLYDNSYEKGVPFSFKFENDNVVDGLHIGFSLIRANEKAFIYIPSKLAYGSKGLVDIVPPNTDIVFDVRVESIK